MALSNSTTNKPYESRDASVWDDLDILIRDCIAKNRHAQKHLYTTYSPMAYAVIKRYTRHDELADEILNDAFMKVFTKIEMYSKKGSFEGWIRKIVVNTVTDHLRKYIKDQQMTHAADMPDEVYMHDDIVGKMSYKELLQVVRGLPDMQRAVFNLFVFEDYKHKEIAELLNISEVNSRWHLNDARKKLKEQLKAIVNQ